ncbi:HAD family hydrolase [Pectinatus sottacetonis]|uniref:HAD family hydrolase n=1 Tax=Pectinatus sottacetonis TaxID=1002795 RepID=UPI0018C6BD30|nr:HAD family hydrolase [Pectinatus sottacetonis]
MIKWIISDMDGTLLDDNGNLPSDFDETIAELKKRNIIFSPASGRQYYALAAQFAKYKDDWLFIAENGTMVSHGDKLLFSVSLPDDMAHSLIKVAVSLKDVCTVVCTCKGSYVIDNDLSFFNEMEKYYTQHQLVDNFASITDPIIKISICDYRHRNIHESAYKYLLKYQKDVQIVMATDTWVDIMPKGINKGIAIKKIQKKLNIKPEECMAFGDFYNDREMLQTVGESYAMENALPEIKEIAKYVAPANNQGGVIKVIRRYLEKTK